MFIKKETLLATFVSENIIEIKIDNLTLESRKMEKQAGNKYKRIYSYGSMSSRSDDDMVVHSQLFPYHKKMVVEREILYEEEHPPFQPLIATTRLFGKARFTCLLLFYVVFYIVYLASGALVFSALEAPMENQIRLELIRAKQDFLTKYPDIIGKYFFCVLRTFTSAY